MPSQEEAAMQPDAAVQRGGHAGTSAKDAERAQWCTACTRRSTEWIIWRGECAEGREHKKTEGRGKRAGCVERGASVHLQWPLKMCLLVAIFFTMGEQVTAQNIIRCFTMSWDVRKYYDCSGNPNVQAGWQSTCTRNPKASVYCASHRISEGCPDTPEIQGVLPCQYDGTVMDSNFGAYLDNFPVGLPQDGSSHCSYREDFTVCNRGLEDCYKMVKERYVKGVLAGWTVQKGCGACPFKKTEVRGARQCEPGAFLERGLDSLNDEADCYLASAQTVTVERCWDCSKDMCNLGARRTVHHATALTFLGFFIILLLRKCRA